MHAIGGGGVIGVTLVILELQAILSKLPELPRVSDIKV